MASVFSPNKLLKQFAKPI
uniref:Uncharacterized protein n=1 Tax=Rhizophora mucronata TaxID=61149 RepID=A0A2P2PRT2_RHIMU